ncbi:MAG: ABC transporter permease [Clostridia bacterium]|nr:ABC transporter permease [Clostridia bacterium]
MKTLKLAFATIRSSKLRAFLTFFGIVLASTLLSVICSFVSTMIGTLDENSATYAAEAMTFMMLVFAVAVAAIVLIRSVFAITFNERVNVLGLYSTVGMTNGGKALMIAAETALYALIGGAIGTAAGKIISVYHIEYMNEGMIKFYLEHYGLDRTGTVFYEYNSPLWVSVASFSLAVLVTAFAAYKPILRLSRLSVINSLKADVSVNVSLTEGIFEKIMCKFFGRIGRLAGQNFDNNAPRYRAVSFTLPCAQIIFVSIYSLFMWGFWEDGVYNAYDDPRLTSGISIGVILTVIALLGAMASMIVNINARKREFATLKSMGMSNRETFKLLLCEGIFIFFHAVVFGLIGSYLSVLGQYLFLWTSNTVQWFHFPWREWIVFVGVDAVFCFAFAVFANLKTLKINIAQSMK